MSHQELSRIFDRYTDFTDVSDVVLRPGDWLILPLESEEEKICLEAITHTTIAPDQENTTVTQVKIVASTNISHQVGSVMEVRREPFGVAIKGAVVKYEDRDVKVDAITVLDMIPYEIVKLIGTKHSHKGRVKFQDAQKHLQAIGLLAICDPQSKEYADQKETISYALKNAKNTLFSHGGWIKFQIGKVKPPVGDVFGTRKGSTDNVRTVDYMKVCDAVYMLLSSGLFGNVVITNIPEK